MAKHPLTGTAAGAAVPQPVIIVDASFLPGVFDAIARAGKTGRPTVARRMLVLALANLDADTGCVLLTRDQFAEQLGVTPADVSYASKTLEAVGVFKRERRPIPGRQGSGVVVYAFNPHLAWAGEPGLRHRWAADFEPPLRRYRARQSD